MAIDGCMLSWEMFLVIMHRVVRFKTGLRGSRPILCCPAVAV